MNRSKMPALVSPKTLKDDYLKSSIEEDNFQTCQELAIKFHVYNKIIRAHCHTLEMVWILNKWFPFELNECNKFQRLSICSSLLSRQKNEHFLDYLLTNDDK